MTPIPTATIAEARAALAACKEFREGDLYDFLDQTRDDLEEQLRPVRVALDALDLLLRQAEGPDPTTHH